MGLIQFSHGNQKFFLFLSEADFVTHVGLLKNRKHRGMKAEGMLLKTVFSLLYLSLIQNGLT